MKTWTIVALALSAGVIALGIALEEGQASSTGLALVILGGSGAAVCITLWAAKVFGFGKTTALRRSDSARVASLITELVDCARQAEARGVLTLAERPLRERRVLFAAGVEMLINADLPAQMRVALSERAERESAAMHAARSRYATMFRLIPIVAVGMALVLMMWMLVALASGRGVTELGSLTPLALVVAVYGAFAIAAISVEIGERISAIAAEDELTGAMVIETIVAIRAGESPERVAAMLHGLTPPDRVAAPPRGLRRAA